MTTFRQSSTPRPRRLQALWWVVAWAFLAIQGGAGFSPQCGSPGMTDCQHCQPHTEGQGCSSSHGCNAQLAAVIVPLLALSYSPMPVTLPTALPGISTLAFDPPLRPPPA
jgi:hypothetical protein